MRGIAVYNQLLFKDENLADDVAVAEKKTGGRSPLQIEKRDQYLLHRFYWKTKIQRRLYPDALDELECEVFLSKLQIQKIIQSKSEIILTIKREQPTRRLLEEKWPHVKW